jgi:hypothetical protein
MVGAKVVVARRINPNVTAPIDRAEITGSSIRPSSQRLWPAAILPIGIIPREPHSRINSRTLIVFKVCTLVVVACQACWSDINILDRRRGGPARVSAGQIIVAVGTGGGIAEYVKAGVCRSWGNITCPVTITTGSTGCRQTISIDAISQVKHVMVPDGPCRRPHRDIWFGRRPDVDNNIWRSNCIPAARGTC